MEKDERVLQARQAMLLPQRTDTVVCSGFVEIPAVDSFTLSFP